MLDDLLERLSASRDANLVAKHWVPAIRTFLEGLDDNLRGGTPELEIGVENRAVLKLTLLPNRLFTTRHLESLPWLSNAQRGLLRFISRSRTRFQYGIKLRPEDLEFELYVNETPDCYLRRVIFSSAPVVGMGDLPDLRAYAITNSGQLSSYWIDPERRALSAISTLVQDSAARSGCIMELWRHHTWDGKSWGRAKNGVQFTPVSPLLDMTLRESLSGLFLADIFGEPKRRHSGHVASAGGRQCLYMTLRELPQ